MTDQEHRICNRRKDGYTILAIAGEFGLTVRQVQRILKLYEVREPRVYAHPPNYRKSSGKYSRLIPIYDHDELTID